MDEEEEIVVEDYLEKMPSWMLRWGTTVFVLFIVLLFIFSYYFSYNTIVQGQFEIINMDLGAVVKSPRNGVIKSTKESNLKLVSEGNVLMELKNTIDYASIKVLKADLSQIIKNREELDSLLPINRKVGEFKPLYLKFLNTYRTYLNHLGAKPSLDRVTIELLETKESLLTKIEIWENENIVKAQINGDIMEEKNWKPGMNVRKGERLYIIHSDYPLGHYGRIKFSPNDKKLIKLNQTVIVKLDAYPYEEFGWLMGKIVDIKIPNLIHKENVFYAYVKLDSMTTTNNIRINKRNSKKGVAEVTGEKSSLFQRVFSTLTD